MTGSILVQIVWAGAAIAVAIAIQFTGLVLIARVLRRWQAFGQSARPHWRVIALGVVTYLLFMLHLIQIVAYALVYYAIGAIPTLRSALYFSAATFTTIGGTQVRTEEPWQLFAALQGLSGIVLVGASVSFLVAIVHRMHFWADD
ncbi:ion channel [Devosia sp. ZB163]|uniref:ion channel n=1 Tax=Devosia sp. ZB163 TaxID=3025938 RepID=UPI00235DCD89|nr:ion channel [Devosia sp. ZB163]MDC9825324.1 ion channel [Devosia sp. ZB163]